MHVKVNDLLKIINQLPEWMLTTEISALKADSLKAKRYILMAISAAVALNLIATTAISIFVDHRGLFSQDASMGLLIEWLVFVSGSLIIFFIAGTKLKIRLRQSEWFRFSNLKELTSLAYRPDFSCDKEEFISRATGVIKSLFSDVQAMEFNLKQAQGSGKTQYEIEMIENDLEESRERLDHHIGIITSCGLISGSALRFISLNEEMLAAS